MNMDIIKNTLPVFTRVFALGAGATACLKLKYLPTVAILLLGFSLSAQIYPAGTNADYAGIRYSMNGDSTIIFTYFSTNHKPRTIKARGLGDSAANFKWYNFENSSKTVNPVPFRIDNGTESEVPLSGEGGYLLVVDNGAVVDTFRAWVFDDEIGIDSVSQVQNCEFMLLTVYPSSNRTNFSQYAYFDFCDLNNVMETFIANTFSVEWNAEKDIYASVDIPQVWKNRVNSLQTVIAPTPFVETPYTVRITNVFGQTTSLFTSAAIPAKGVYAAFEVLIPDEAGIFKPSTTLEGEAMLLMKLNNKSINADKFEWTGWNNQKINFLQNDTLWSFDTEHVTDEFVYRPGEYPVKLTVENVQTGCRSSTYSLAGGKRKDVRVYESTFPPESFPNAFTPNGDGNNDVFTFVAGSKPRSMRMMEMKIVNRNGLLVYKYRGEVSKWEGWNGKINGNGSECSTGVYYFVVSGDGWDDKSYSGKQYTGAVHLFR